MSIKPNQPTPIAQRSPGRPSLSDAGDLHALYLRAALETFLSRGYEGASIEEIARVAKAGKMTLYRLFGNKEELFRRVVRDAIARMREQVKVSYGPDEATDVVLQRIVRQLHDGLSDPMFLEIQRLVVAEYQRFPELANTLRSHKFEVLGPVEAFLRDAVERRRLVLDDVRAGAYQLSTLASGGVRFLITEPLDSEERKQAWARAVATFAWNSWRPRSNEAPGSNS